MVAYLIAINWKKIPVPESVWFYSPILEITHYCTRIWMKQKDTNKYETCLIQIYAHKKYMHTIS